MKKIFSLSDTAPSALDQTMVDSQPPTPAPILLIGEQIIQKFGKEKKPEDRVRIYLALWRLTPAKDVDLILSLNEPLSTSEEQASSKANETFIQAAKTLRIKDWGLFAS